MTRREWIALGGLLISSACGPKKGTGYAGYVLIATSGDPSLAVVDLTAFRLLHSIPLGAAPAAILPGGPDGRIYVLTPSAGSVYILDRALKIVASRKLADELSEIRITPDRRRLVAIAAPSRQLIEADPISLQVLRRHRLEAAPIAFDVPPPPDSGNPPAPPYVAVSTGAHGTVSLFQLDSGQHSRAELQAELGAVRFRADGQLLLVANLQDSSLTGLSVTALDRIADLPLAMKPENLCFNFDQGQLFVSGEGMDGVAIVFPYHMLQVDQTVLAGRDPGVMACSANPPYLFVGSNNGSDVCILNIDTRKVIGIVDVGQRPSYITVTPDSQYALILDEREGDLAVIHIPAIQASQDAGYNFRRKSGASLFTMLPVGDKPVHAAVVPRSL